MKLVCGWAYVITTMEAVVQTLSVSTTRLCQLGHVAATPATSVTVKDQMVAFPLAVLHLRMLAHPTLVRMAATALLEVTLTRVHA